MPDKHDLPREALLQRVKLTKPSHFLAFGFGSGLAPKAPGTFGSLAAIPLLLLMSHMPFWAYGAITLVSMIAGIWICQKAADDLQTHDHPAIVWDEIAGMFITFIAVPLTPLNLLIGFVLFRIFDIAKPWPIRWADKKVHGGLGIMLDDILAGVIAALILHLGLHFLL